MSSKSESKCTNPDEPGLDVKALKQQILDIKKNDSSMEEKLKSYESVRKKLLEIDCKDSKNEIKVLEKNIKKINQDLKNKKEEAERKARRLETEQKREACNKILSQLEKKKQNILKNNDSSISKEEKLQNIIERIDKVLTDKSCYGINSGELKKLEKTVKKEQENLQKKREKQEKEQEELARQKKKLLSTVDALYATEIANAKTQKDLDDILKRIEAQKAQKERQAEEEKKEEKMFEELIQKRRKAKETISDLGLPNSDKLVQQIEKAKLADIKKIVKKAKKQQKKRETLQAEYNQRLKEAEEKEMREKLEKAKNNAIKNLPKSDIGNYRRETFANIIKEDKSIENVNKTLKRAEVLSLKEQEEKDAADQQKKKEDEAKQSEARKKQQIANREKEAKQSEARKKQQKEEATLKKIAEEAVKKKCDDDEKRLKKKIEKLQDLDENGFKDLEKEINEYEKNHKGLLCEKNVEQLKKQLEAKRPSFFTKQDAKNSIEQKRSLELIKIETEDEKNRVLELITRLAPEECGTDVKTDTKDILDAYQTSDMRYYKNNTKWDEATAVALLEFNMNVDKFFGETKNEVFALGREFVKGFDSNTKKNIPITFAKKSKVTCLHWLIKKTNATKNVEPRGFFKKVLEAIETPYLFFQIGCNVEDNINYYKKQGASMINLKATISNKTNIQETVKTIFSKIKVDGKQSKYEVDVLDEKKDAQLRKYLRDAIAESQFAFKAKVGLNNFKDFMNAFNNTKPKPVAKSKRGRKKLFDLQSIWDDQEDLMVPPPSSLGLAARKAREFMVFE